jgi:hypothetical protein
MPGFFFIVLDLDLDGHASAALMLGGIGQGANDKGHRIVHLVPQADGKLGFVDVHGYSSLVMMMVV